MAELYIDRVDNLSATESHGTIRSLTRKARIRFTDADRKSDYDALGAALQLLDDSGMGWFSTLAPIQSLSRYASLVLIRRSPALAENDPSVVDVVLEYQHVMDGPNQSAKAPASGVLYVKGKTSVSDKATNFYFPNGIRIVNPDGTDNRRQIIVSHKFPKWEVGIAAVPIDPNFPRVVFQGGDINIPFPQANLSLQGIVRTNSPQQISDDLTTTVNGVRWMNADPAFWMCTEVTWEPNDPAVSLLGGIGNNPTAQTFKMAFEFQKNSDGWDPVAAFNDSRTGRPPSGLERANIVGDPAVGVLDYYQEPGPVVGPPVRARPAGYWQVPALRRVDFAAYFGSGGTAVVFNGAG